MFTLLFFFDKGIKRGIVEQSDLIIINKCDGDLVPAARRIKAEYTSALKFMRKKSVHWKPKVKMMSSKTGDGLEEVSEVMSKFREVMTEAGELETKRALQRKKWMWSYINDRLIEVFQFAGCHLDRIGLMFFIVLSSRIQIFTSDPGIRSRSHLYEGQVINYQLSPGTAADILIEQFLKTQKATKS